MMYQFRLTEEIARWAFEIICRENKDWFVAFTNPTAGPWKKITALNKSGQEGEVYRFELEETRPDIVLVNDKLETVLVIEAKDSLDKLLSDTQSIKSVEVVANLRSILKNKYNNQFWGERSKYVVLTGLLWGAELPTDKNERDLAFKYYSDMKPYPELEKSLLVGIETRRFGDGLKCYMCGKEFTSTPKIPSLKNIADSFSMPII